MNSYSESYKKAGVDVTAGYRAVELMKAHVARTMTSGVLSGIGSSENLDALVLVAFFSGVARGAVVESQTDGIE